jgi:hypothetical protein
MDTVLPGDARDRRDVDDRAAASRLDDRIAGDDTDVPLEKIERLERLAAWHRINAERAGADWVWEARLRTAEDLERQAAKIRAQMADDPWTTQS